MTRTGHPFTHASASDLFFIVSRRDFSWVLASAFNLFEPAFQFFIKVYEIHLQHDSICVEEKVACVLFAASQHTSSLLASSIIVNSRTFTAPSMKSMMYTFPLSSPQSVSIAFLTADLIPSKLTTIFSAILSASAFDQYSSCLKALSTLKCSCDL